MNENMGESSMIDTGVLNRNPFPGIRPFTSAEDQYFFGRETAKSEVLELLHDNRFVALVGASASGKTSLIQSGIIPALITDEKQDWVPVSIRPGTKPLENLVRGFQKVFPKKLKETDIQSFLNSDQDLGELIIEKGLGSHNYFLVVDQFEELFRHGPESRIIGKSPDVKRFVDLLVKAAKRDRPGIYVMLSIRSDFIEASSASRSLTELMNRSKYLLPQMSREALSSSIKGPVELAGARYEPGFVEYLLDDLEDLETPLPQLQHALMRTWDNWSAHDGNDQLISISDYQAIGSVNSALSNHLEEAFAELDDQQKDICEKLFKSVTSKSEMHKGFRRQATMANISRIAQCSLEELTDVVEVFGRPGSAFLSLNQPMALSSDSVLEISHESLIRIWKRLGQWVDEEDESIKMYLKLSEASALYQQGRTELLKHPDLQLALNWRDTQKPTPSWGVQYHPAFERAMVFLKTSEEEQIWDEERKVILQKRRLFLNRAVAVFMGVLVVVLAVVFLTTRNTPTGDPVTDQMVAQDELPVNATAGEDPLLSQSDVDQPAEIVDQSSELQAANETERIVTPATTSRVNSDRNRPVNTNLSSRNTSTATSSNVTNQSTRTDAVLTLPPDNSAEKELLFAGMAIDIAKQVAVQSISMTQTPDLQGLLAYQAYQINRQYNGSAYDRDIYTGLYTSLKKLISPAYNIYPNLRNSIKDIQWLHRTGSMITASSDGTIKILSGTFSNRASQITLRSTGQNNECMIISPDEKLAAVGTNGGGLLFLELENQGGVVSQNTEDGKIVLFLSNLGNTGSFISAGTDNRILKWDYENQSSSLLTATDSRPSALASSLNGGKVAYGTRDGKLFEFDAESPDNKRVIKEFGQIHAKAIAYSPGGQTIVVGLMDGSLQVLSGSGRQLVATLRGPNASVTDIAYSPDGKFLAVASRDGKVYLWNSVDWSNPPLVFEENNGFVLSVCFSGEGNYFYSGSVDYPRLIGRPSSTDEMAQNYCSLIGRNLTQAEWDQYFGGDIPYVETCPGGN